MKRQMNRSGRDESLQSVSKLTRMNKSPPKMRKKRHRCYCNRTHHRICKPHLDAARDVRIGLANLARSHQPKKSTK